MANTTGEQWQNSQEARVSWWQPKTSTTSRRCQNGEWTPTTSNESLKEELRSPGPVELQQIVQGPELQGELIPPSRGQDEKSCGPC